MVRVFLSSVVGGFEGERMQLADALRTAGMDVWLSEEQHPRLGSRPPFKGKWSRRVCLEAVRESDVYVGVFSTRYGGSERQHHAHVALTELEFYEAFRRDKPVLLYVLDAPLRERQLADSLVFLRELVPGHVHPVADLRTLYSRIAKDVESRSPRRRAPTWPQSAFDRFFDRLVGLRPHQTVTTGLRFLDGSFPPPRESADGDWIDEALEQLPRLPSYADRLNEAWAVIRALCETPWPDHRDDLRVLRRWDQALETWGKCAAWTGLHGPLLAGTLSAFHSMLDIRTLRTSRGRTEDWVAQADAMGPLASAYYSMAIRCRIARHRDAYLHRSLELLDASERRGSLLGMDRKLDRDTIKAYALLRLKRVNEALSTFEAVLQARKDLGAGADAIAESSGDVGWALMHSGRTADGTSLLEYAVEQLQRSANPDSAGFLIRAKLKLSAAYRDRYRLLASARQLSEVRALCSAVGAWDQWRKVGTAGRLLVACLGERLAVRQDATGFKYERA